MNYQSRNGSDDGFTSHEVDVKATIQNGNGDLAHESFSTSCDPKFDFQRLLEKSEPLDKDLLVNLHDSRISSVAAVDRAIQGIPEKIAGETARVIMRAAANGNGTSFSLEATRKNSQEKIKQVLRGIVTGAHLPLELRALWNGPGDGGPKEYAKSRLFDLTVYVFLKFLLPTVDEAGTVTSRTWPPRDEPSLGRKVPNPIHSWIGHGVLGRYFFGDEYSEIDQVASLMHDLTEEAKKLIESMGKFQVIEVGDLQKTRLDQIAEVYFQFPEYGLTSALSMEGLTERRYRSAKGMLNKTHKAEYKKFVRATLAEWEGYKAFNSKEFKRTFEQGTVNFGALALQELELVRVLLENAEDPQLRKNINEPRKEVLIRNASALLCAGILDRIDDIFTIHRYVYDEKNSPEFARAKTIAYVTRQLNAFEKFLKGVQLLPVERREKFSKIAEQFIPVLFGIIDVCVNPKLLERGQKSIEQGELLNYYRTFHLPIQQKVDELVLPTVQERIPAIISPLTNPSFILRTFAL